MLTLFYAPGACSLVPHIVLEEASARYERHAVDYAAGENHGQAFRAISPLGRVPILLTGQGPISENPAILTYIAQTHPQSDLALMPDPFAFAQVQAFNLFIASNIHVAFRQISFPDGYADGPDAAEALKRKVPELADRYFAVIEERMRDGRPFVHGDRFTTSDVYLFVYANYLRIGDRGDPSRLPHILAHRARIGARPAVRHILEIEGLAAAWRD